MLRLLLCMTCCSAPPSRSGHIRPNINNTNNKTQSDNKPVSDSEKANSGLQDNEKVQLLTNQIQAHNDNYGTKEKKTTALASAVSNQSVEKLMQDDDSITASTSALLQKSKTAASNEDKDYTKYTELNFDDKSVTPPSSIDVEQFKESPNESGQQQQQQQQQELSSSGELLAKSVSDYFYDNNDYDFNTTNNNNNMYKYDNNTNDQVEQKMYGDFVDSSGSRDRGEFAFKGGQVNKNYSNNDELASFKNNDPSTTTTITATATAITTSTTSASAKANFTPISTSVTTTSKIGDYARLEYSPIDDSDSMHTNKSHSRAGSDGAGIRASLLRRRSSNLAGGGASSSGGRSPTSREGGDLSENISRRSSQGGGGGIESTSISIASQLSNEQFQQNLTNMLESANSPTALFGTIGLPLGPPLDKDMTETRKTSPETTGAALTSASLDSLSDSSIGVGIASGVKRSGPTTIESSNATSGGALVNDSIERQQQLFTVNSTNSTMPTSNREEDDSEISTLINSKSSLTTTLIGNSQQERVESAMSTATTTSGGLTNPTPTPSELSGGNGSKKKGKLRPKNLLKRFKSGKKKSKDESDDK